MVAYGMSGMDCYGEVLSDYPLFHKSMVPQVHGQSMVPRVHGLTNPWPHGLEAWSHESMVQ